MVASQRIVLKAPPISPAIAEAVAALTDELMRYGRDAARFFVAQRDAPDDPFGNAVAGMLHLFTTTREGNARAAPFLSAARRDAGRAGERERMFIQAVSLWEAGNPRAAIAVHRATLQLWPDDLLSLKLCQLHELALGDLKGLLATARFAATEQPGNRYLHGMLAFALGQNGLHREAEQAGRKACARGVDPWARHAVAHSLAAHGRAEAGLSWMTEHAAEWDHCSSFLYTHNWWHAALFHLDLRNPAGALGCFDTRIWGVRKDCCQDQLNAISLLARLEMHGADAGQRWSDIAAYVAPRVHDHLSGFLDLHYIYALAKAERTREVREMLASLDAWAGTCPLTDARLKAVMPVAARGLVAHAQGRFYEAARLLGDLRADFVRLGGSDVQRQLFERVYQDSAARAVRLVRRAASA
jgi:tetratricopeptide (TPR) repeat protein